MEYDEFLARNSWKYGDCLQKWISKRIIKELIRVGKITPNRTNVLEVGSGLGSLAAEIQKCEFLSYTAIEPNRRLAERTRRVFPGAEVYEVALPKVPIGLDDKFDVIICVHVIEHALNGYEAREWLKALNSLLNENGKIFIISPDIKDFKSYFWDIDWSHCFPTSKENLKQIFNDLGMKVMFSGNFKLGSVKSVANLIGTCINIVLPTRLLNSLGYAVANRPLGSGVKTALIWAATFVVAEKNAI
jgi:SAM-dependent methyltransferase